MKNPIFAGIDVGGTKISAGIVAETGKILHQDKRPTPPRATSKEILNVIIELLRDLSRDAKLNLNDLSGIGIGIPGIVHAKGDKILITPNINLSGFPLSQEVAKKTGVQAALGNDVNLGLLGEKWLGAGQGAENIVGIFPGTGVGGAIIINGKLYLGAQGLAAEIGHMIMDLNGPPCSCGNSGCLEALTSRWAIERDIRQAVKKGAKTAVTELTEGNLSLIKSRILKKALKRKDPLVTEVLKNVSEILGKACISLRHLLNPEKIILGGGVIEACADFMIPIIKKTAQRDPFFAKLDSCLIVKSQLGDDAVILGAVALIREPAKK
ncbi:MAG: ROK family protein [Candidatus Omnitrophota bacterium]